ncbi:helix-turn-helix domain-containing protein [Amycolatopsis sp., V23-08]|uniref:Helix-turn-helix domain-containing protein n=1 Tax=Amycolatopsis heterodermiae TaxID=3110235 RepID=A0ABU5QX35_9PSEU|nr:helix-turn-helix domain-containing protein [Amycolatopsis sp., V23-08]MEA5358486.1 helix-turn-helix domain-containing protein [Amycolatopsis sp., V23-08]
MLSPDVLGRTRFCFSPLAEATSSLRLLGLPRPAHVHTPWLRQARARLDGVDLELLLSVVPPGRYIASCLVPRGRIPQPSLEDQLSALTAVTVDELERDLREVWSGRTPPRQVADLLASGARATARLAEALWDYWDAVIRPHWPRMCAVLEDDVSRRMAALVDHGFYALLRDLHPEVGVEGNLLHIDKPHFADAVYEASEMILTPSVFTWPDLILEDGETGCFGLTYAARGIARVWEGADALTPKTAEPLATLLGRTRAAILRRTDVPMSTTRIARELGQSPASVSEHLAVLRDAGLVTSRRSGRSVLYRQTPLAEHVLRAQLGGIQDESAGR